MTEPLEDENTIFHALGILEDFHRKKEEAQREFHTKLSLMGFCQVFLWASILGVFHNSEMLSLFIFGGPIFLMGSGTFYFLARHSKKKIGHLNQQMTDLASTLKDVRKLNPSLSPLTYEMIQIRLNRLQ